MNYSIGFQREKNFIARKLNWIQYCGTRKHQIERKFSFLSIDKWSQENKWTTNKKELKEEKRKKKPFRVARKGNFCSVFLPCPIDQLTLWVLNWMLGMLWISILC